MEATCGDCRYFRVTREREDGRLGECRIQKLMGVFRDTMRPCPSFSRQGDPNPPVVGDAGRRARVRRRPDGPRPLERVSANALAATLGNLSPDQLKTALTAALSDAMHGSELELGRAWTAGEVHLVPADDELKPKVLSFETYFHKLVMIRDNLRVLEQKLNTHEHLQDSEKLDLQRRVTLCFDALARMGSGWVPDEPEGGPLAEARGVLRRLSDEVRSDSLALAMPAIGERWAGGSARYARDTGPHAEAHVEPIERFFHRLAVLRDRLVTLDATVGAHAHIAPDDADAIGSYIRRCYGTLTTFNVLFRDREDYFASAK